MNKMWHWRLAAILFGVAYIALVLAGHMAGEFLILAWLCMSTGVLMDLADRRLKVAVYVKREEAR